MFIQSKRSNFSFVVNEEAGGEFLAENDDIFNLTIKRGFVVSREWRSMEKGSREEGIVYGNVDYQFL